MNILEKRIDSSEKIQREELFDGKYKTVTLSLFRAAILNKRQTLSPAETISAPVSTKKSRCSHGENVCSVRESTGATVFLSSRKTESLIPRQVVGSVTAQGGAEKRLRAISAPVGSNPP